MVKHVIDADNNIVLEQFDRKDSQAIKAKYIALGKWEDVSLDIDGDLILWKV